MNLVVGVLSLARCVMMLHVLLQWDSQILSLLKEFNILCDEVMWPSQIMYGIFILFSFTQYRRLNTTLNSTWLYTDMVMPQKAIYISRVFCLFNFVHEGMDIIVHKKNGIHATAFIHDGPM